MPENKIGHEFRQRAIKEISRLSNLVSDFVAIGKPSPIEPSPVDLLIIIRDVVSLLSPGAQESDVVIVVDGENDLPEMMLDGNKIKQTIMNLILNGIQSMPEGGTIAISIARSSDGVSVRIHDEGMGIHEADQEKIFAPFYTTKRLGSGLGLPLANQIAEAHGGRLELRETGSTGTTFVLHLPFKSQKTRITDE